MEILLSVVTLVEQLQNSKKMREHNSSLNHIIFTVVIMVPYGHADANEIELLSSFHWHQHGRRVSYHKKMTSLMSSVDKLPP